MADKLVTISIASKNKELADRVLTAIRNMPEYAADDAEFGPDRRRPGAVSIYQEAFVFHVS